jgi:drug/metabolite transporter (DMT)-like permease|tara:strand:- start:731 stop:1576 length:846 start_codon:yes stop_codon:yes gene_type:complete
MFLVSTDALLVRVAERDSAVDGWTIACMVGLFSSPVAWSLAVRNIGRDFGHELVRWRRPLLATGLLGAVGTTSFLTAVTLTATSNVVAIIASGPIFAAVLARIALHERTSMRTWRAIGLTLIGIVVIVGGSMASGGIAGDLIALLAIMVFAVNLVLWRKYPDLPRTLVVAVTATCTFLLTAVPADTNLLDRRALLATLAMGGLFGPIARLCMSTATRHAPPAEVSLFTPVETVAASLWVWLWFDEVPATPTFIGGVIVVASVFYGLTGPAREVDPEPPRQA